MRIPSIFLAFFLASPLLAGGLAYDTYSGYFVSNKFEPDAAESFVVITDQEQFDKVFGAAFVMKDKSHRLPQDAFKSLIVVAVIKRGSAIWQYKVDDVTEANGNAEVFFTATSKKSDTATFACPLIVSLPKNQYTSVRFVENGKMVKKVEISGGKPVLEDTRGKNGASTSGSTAHPSQATHIQGTIILAPDENGTFTIQPQGTKLPAEALKIATDRKTTVTVAQEKGEITDLKTRMWARAEIKRGFATGIVAGCLWLEDGEKLVLFKGLPPEFFTHPAGFDVNNVTTKFGPLRMVYRLTGNGSYLRWGRKALPKEGMIVCWPTNLKARFSYGPPVKPNEQGLIHLPADVSELRIWFIDPIVPKKDKSTNSQKTQPPFILGADISWVQQQEDEGILFTDQGKQKDILAILKDHGFNWIRLRIFHNPKAVKGYSKQSYSDLDHSLVMAKRIKAAGIGFLLDFHYSDTWADPGHQIKPTAWLNLQGADLEKAVHDYTHDVVAALKKQGTPPDILRDESRGGRKKIVKPIPGNGSGRMDTYVSSLIEGGDSTVAFLKDKLDPGEKRS